jgi:outer membrane biosynthesis protein TonB
MANIGDMQDQFESKKNVKAGTYTLLICGGLLVILLFVRWTLPALPVPSVDEGIEVNLGNSDMGSGDDQPFLPGPPAPANQTAYVPPKVTTAEPESVKDVETDDKAEDAPEIKKPPVIKPDAKKIPEKDVAKTTPKKIDQPVTNPTPPAPRPKAQMKGVSGTGTGGNEADTYKKGGNQGVAGGNGDQGRPGGDPDSKNYTGGGTGNSGVSISKGLEGRRFTKLPSFQDEFNENAKIAIDIHVDGQGNVTAATYQPRGSTTADASMKEIAIRKAYQIKLNSNGDESIGTIIFNFKLRN